MKTSVLAVSIVAAVGLAVTATVLNAAPATRKPVLSDTLQATVYADNWFSLYINGELVAVDSIAFMPHNIVTVDLLPTYPMTLAVVAKDNFDPDTGMEYANTKIGDGGFILHFSDGTVTDATWKALPISRGPINGDTQNPRVESVDPPEGWTQPDFDDADWPAATVFSEEAVRPQRTFYDHDFGNAQFIWSPDLALDNIILFRKTVASPPDGVERPDFSDLNDIVPARGPRPPGGKRPGEPRP